MNSPARFSGMLVLSLVVILGSNPCAFAQDQQDPNKTIVEELQKDIVRRTGKGAQNMGMQFSYQPIFRGSVTTSKGQEKADEKRTKSVEIGLKDTHTQSIPIRPMQGFMQVANSDDVAKMVKGMIKMKVPVMYQTMMMVENGAATGFIGAMGNMNGLLDSTMQASQLQIAMYEAMDPGGQRAHEYGKAVYEGLQIEGHNNSWPMALWAANSDQLEPDKANSDVKGATVQHKYKRPTNELGGPGVNANLMDENSKSIEGGDDKSKQISLIDLTFEPLDKGEK